MSNSFTSTIPGVENRRSSTSDSTSDRRNPVARFYGPLAERRTWKETAALLVALPVGVAWFTVAITGLSLAAGLAITLVGLPLLAATVAFGRVVGAAERAKARAFYDTALPAPEPVSRDGTAWTRMKRVISDRHGWRGLLHAVLALPLGVVWFTATVTLWATAAFAATFPIHHWFLSDDGAYRITDDYVIRGVGPVAGATVVGLVLLGLAPRIVRAMAAADRGIIRRLVSRVD